MVMSQTADSIVAQMDRDTDILTHLEPVQIEEQCKQKLL